MYRREDFFALYIFRFNNQRASPLPLPFPLPLPLPLPLHLSASRPCVLVFQRDCSLHAFQLLLSYVVSNQQQSRPQAVVKPVLSPHIK